MKVNIWKMVATVSLIIIVGGVVTIVKVVNQNEAEKIRIELEKQKEAEKKKIEEHNRDIENKILNSLSNYVDRHVVNQLIEVQIISDNITVGGGNVKTYSFVIPNDISIKAHVFGAFKASGGFQSNIRVHLMDKFEFENFKNHNQFKSYYESGKVTAEKIDKTLAPGDYVLVFDNVGGFANRDVNADIKLEVYPNYQMTK